MKNEHVRGVSPSQLTLANKEAIKIAKDPLGSQ